MTSPFLMPHHLHVPCVLEFGLLLPLSTAAATERKLSARCRVPILIFAHLSPVGPILELFSSILTTSAILSTWRFHARSHLATGFWFPPSKAASPSRPFFNHLLPHPASPSSPLLLLLPPQPSIHLYILLFFLPPSLHQSLLGLWLSWPHISLTYSAFVRAHRVTQSTLPRLLCPSPSADDIINPT